MPALGLVWASGARLRRQEALRPARLAPRSAAASRAADTGELSEPTEVAEP